MRRRKDPEKRRRAYALFIIIVMVMSVAGIIGVQKSGIGQSLTYNKQKFYETDQGFRTKIDNEWLTFNFHPLNLETFDVSEKVKSSLESPQYLVTYNPNATNAPTMAQIQLFWSQILPKYTGKDIVRGLTNNSGYEGIKQVTCDDATESVPVIVLQDSNSTSIIAKNNCIELAASSARDLVRIEERLLYIVFGIMD